MDRRSVLIGAAISAVGVGWFTYGDQLGDISQGRESLKTENPIKRFGEDAFMKEFTLYESGAARFIFKDDYGCYDRVAVGDSTPLRERNLAVWNLPRDGELVVNMKRAVSRTKDPSNEFWLTSIGGKDSYCFSGYGIHERFSVPEHWIN